LDSGLIEAEFLAHPREDTARRRERQWQYLSYPLRGPYPLPDPTVVSAISHESWLQAFLNGLPRRETRVWLLSRSRKSTVDRFLRRLGEKREIRDVSRRRVGRLRVARIDFQAW
jgi:hypothetical protein